MAKPRIQTRVDPPQKERIDDWIEEQDFNADSEAIRHLVMTGLDYEEGRLATGSDDSETERAVKENEDRGRRAAYLGLFLALSGAVLNTLGFVGPIFNAVLQSVILVLFGVLLVSLAFAAVGLLRLNYSRVEATKTAALETLSPFGREAA